jgi:hypothetical protein
VTGTATVVGDIIDYASVEIGIVRTGHSGNATGILDLDGDLVTTDMRIGVSEGTGIASGLVDINNNLVIIDNEMILGDGSTIDLGVDGLLRGMNYGAFDVGTAQLDGVLDLLFSFTPGSGIFDLIVSESLTGIAGDFDLVNIMGLAPGTLVTYGTVVDFGVEIYRLEIGVGEPIPNPVPEPTTLILLCVGFAGFVFARKRMAA